MAACRFSPADAMCSEAEMTVHKKMHWQGCNVAFLTQHGKQHLVGPPIEAALGCRILHTEGYDTDKLGTFTHELARPGSQMDAAREKARIGMALTGSSIGIASEGSFGPDPVGGFVPWNTEVLLWIDQKQDLEITGWAHGPAQSLQKPIQSLQELELFALEAKFPEHRLTMRPSHEDHPAIIKGIHNVPSLMEAFERCRSQSNNGLVYVENDLRAFCNPTRQNIIRNAASDLIQKLQSLCPACDAPGFWVDRRIPGLRCRVCGRKTRLPISEVWHCQICKMQEERAIHTKALADPARCDHCNP